MALPSATQITELNRSGHFDPTWYCKAYPDVDVARLDPALHYLRYGHRLGRNPGPSFDTGFARMVYKIAVEQEPLAWLERQRKLHGRPAQPDAQVVLQAASMVAQRGDHARAISLARNHLRADLAYTLNILKANAAIAAGDEASWQRHLNHYLEHYALAPIRLDGSGSLLQRLSTAPLAPVTEGPLISVIMTAWNAEGTVRAAAMSILRQTWRNLELLIVDDCSTDGTWQILQQIAASDQRVRIFRNVANVGTYVSKTIASTQAKGEWLTGHDADDWAHPERLARHLDFCFREDVPASLAGMLRATPKGEFSQINPIGGFVYDGACRGAFILLMIRTQFFRDVLGGWDHVRTSGDSEILRRIETLTRCPTRQLDCVTMLSLDQPGSLTNHPILGHRIEGRVSAQRLAYKKGYAGWHAGLTSTQSRIELVPGQRRFEAPADLLASPAAVAETLEGYRIQGLRFGKSLDVDVALVTNTRFPGGNASSSLDELSLFRSLGLSIALIHCPIDADLGKPISERYRDYADCWHNWSDIDALNCKVLIGRHPAAVTSHAFRTLLPVMRAEHAFLVKNNSVLRPSGNSVYSMSDFIAMPTAIPAKTVTLCPISQVMREELVAYADAHSIALPLSAANWTPTFDLSLYFQAPKPQMRAPFRVGRHGRDGPEKWHEDPEAIRMAYPAGPDFRISILGGAKRAVEILGGMPQNWHVHDFGSIEPYAYLRELDVFVYFPNSALVEAFGRTIVEAMLAGIPVILPEAFRTIFGDIPLYCRPSRVSDLIFKLASGNSERISYLEEVQKIAAERYSNRVIYQRLAGTGLLPPLKSISDDIDLSSQSHGYRRSLMCEDPSEDPALCRQLASRKSGGLAYSRRTHERESDDVAQRYTDRVTQEY